MPHRRDAPSRSASGTLTASRRRAGKITIELNGVKTVDANLDNHKEKFDQAHPGLTRETGYIGLQSHDGRVEFRNLFVKPLQ